MIRTTARAARKLHRCECHRQIKAGERYLEHVASPNHDDLGNQGWWRIAECADCAEQYGRGHLLVAASVTEGDQ